MQALLVLCIVLVVYTMAPPCAKRKRKVLTIAKKVEILERIEAPTMLTGMLRRWIVLFIRYFTSLFNVSWAFDSET